MLKKAMNNSAAKAGLGYTIGNVLIRGISFFTLPIFTRLMSTADFGLYMTYVSYEGILGIIVSLGLYASLKAAKADYKERIDHYVSVVSCVPIVFTAFLVVLLIPFGSLLGKYTGFGRSVLLLMLGQAWSSSVLMMYNARVGLDFAYLNYIRISVISTVLNVLLSLFLIVFITPNQPFLGRIMGTSLPFMGIGLVLTVLFFHRSKPVYDKDTVVYGLKYSLPLVPHGLSQQILSQFGKIIIQRKIGNDAAGLYGFAYTIAIIPQVLVTSLDAAWGPWFFEKYSEHKIDLIKQKTIQYVALFSTIIIGLVCVSPEIIRIMGDISYYPSSYIVCPAILGVFFTFLYGIPVQIEYFYKKTKYIAIGTMIVAAVNIIACLTLIPRYGYEVAAYITVVTYAVYFIAHLLIARGITKKNLPFETRKIILYVVLVCSVTALSQIFIDRLIVRWIMMFAVVFAIGYINREAVKEFAKKDLFLIRRK
ncbi:MAG: oligosaccharide flippase family protein [Christensenellaceae bacterium]